MLHTGSRVREQLSCSLHLKHLGCHGPVDSLAIQALRIRLQLIQSVLRFCSEVVIQIPIVMFTLHGGRHGRVNQLWPARRVASPKVSHFRVVATCAQALIDERQSNLRRQHAAVEGAERDAIAVSVSDAAPTRRSCIRARTHVLEESRPTSRVSECARRRARAKAS